MFHANKLQRLQKMRRGYSTSPKKRIVVVGGGPAGLSIANTKVRNNYDVTLIEPSQYHYYQPLWTLVGGGVSKIEDTQKLNKDFIDARINWIEKKAVNFEPEKNKVVLDGGETIEYDALVVSIGLEIYWDRIKGLKESIGKNGVCSNYSYKYAPKTWEFLNESQGGQYLFTFPPTPVKCAGAPQKIMYLAEAHLVKRGLRDRSSVNFYSAVGELFAVKHYSDALNAICDKRNIHRNFGHNLIEIDGEKKKATFQKVKAISGSEETVEVDYDFLHVTPHMGPYTWIKQTPIVNNDGWVDVNKSTLQHTKFPNIFSLGDCSSLPTSKTAAAITAQSGVLKKNLDAFMKGTELTASYDGYTSCPITTGYGKLMLAEFDYDKKTRESFPGFDQRTESKILYLMKEKLFPYLYWKYLLPGIWEGPTNIPAFFANLIHGIKRRN